MRFKTRKICMCGLPGNLCNLCAKSVSAFLRKNYEQRDSERHDDGKTESIWKVTKADNTHEVIFFSNCACFRKEEINDMIRGIRSRIRE